MVLAQVPLNREQVADSNNYAEANRRDFEAVKVCDAAFIDDRFMNRHGTMCIDERAVPIFTSLDFVETLHHKGLYLKNKLDVRTSFRELGFEFVGISAERT